MGKKNMQKNGSLECEEDRKNTREETRGKTRE